MLILYAHPGVPLLELPRILPQNYCSRRHFAAKDLVETVKNTVLLKKVINHHGLRIIETLKVLDDSKLVQVFSSRTA